MKSLPSVATLTVLLLTGCSDSPVSPTEQSSATASALSPASGPVGTRVVIRGSGFSKTGNTVSFAAVTLENSAEMPNEPGVIPQLSSADGLSIAFDVPSQWRPACSYATQGPCPFARIATAPGTYRVTVTSETRTSTPLMFAVTR